MKQEIGKLLSVDPALMTDELKIGWAIWALQALLRAELARIERAERSDAIFRQMHENNLG